MLTITRVSSLDLGDTSIASFVSGLLVAVAIRIENMPRFIYAENHLASGSPPSSKSGRRKQNNIPPDQEGSVVKQKHPCPPWPVHTTPRIHRATLSPPSSQNAIVRRRLRKPVLPCARYREMYAVRITIVTVKGGGF